MNDGFSEHKGSIVIYTSDRVHSLYISILGNIIKSLSKSLPLRTFMEEIPKEFAFMEKCNSYVTFF